MRDDRVYLQHIAQSVRLVRQYLVDARGDWDQDAFFNDVRTQDAVLRRMETLADAASHLSAALQSRHPAVPWHAIRDFRNVLAHGYSDIRLDLVWASIITDLAQLQAAIDSELNNPPTN
jgi:uncharacterized protein with HEPN domain